MNKQHLKPLKLLESGLIRHQNGEFNEAIAIYQKILAVNPLHFDALKLLGTVYAQTNKFELALSLFDIALKIKPNNIGLLNNRGNILKELQRTDEALESYNKAIEIRPDYAEAWSNCGVVLNELKRFDEALASYKKAIALESGYAEAIFNCGVMQLHNLQFTDGWVGYEARWHTKEFNSKPLLTSKSRWCGIKSEQRLFICAEQGIGDQILYGSIFNELQNFPNNKIISADKKLIPVFQRSFPSCQFIDKLKYYRKISMMNKYPSAVLVSFLEKS